MLQNSVCEQDSKVGISALYVITVDKNDQILVSFVRQIFLANVYNNCVDSIIPESAIDL